jgi:hypothetical protein
MIKFNMDAAPSKKKGDLNVQDKDIKEFPVNPLAETEEFKFHQDRFSQAADKRNKKYFNRFLKKKITNVDVAHEEALRDNIDFEKRKDQEFKEWQKNLKVVINHLKIRRDDPEVAIACFRRRDAGPL